MLINFSWNIIPIFFSQSMNCYVKRTLRMRSTLLTNTVSLLHNWWWHVKYDFSATPCEPYFLRVLILAKTLSNFGKRLVIVDFYFRVVKFMAFFFIRGLLVMSPSNCFDVLFSHWKMWVWKSLLKSCSWTPVRLRKVALFMHFLLIIYYI